MQRDDASLVQAFIAGDREAFGELIERHRPRVRALARAMLGEAGAEDVAQEATYHAFFQILRLREPARFGAWLYGIALNLARMELRKYRLLTSLEGLAFELPGFATAPEAAAEAADLQRRLEIALSQLPTETRTAVWLHYVEGLSYDELSSITGRSPGSMRVQSHRARQRLQRELAIEKPHQRQRRTTVEAEIADVWIRMPRDGSWDPVMRTPRWAVELRTKDASRSLLIFIGNEATGIAMQIAGVEPPRPQTYAFMARLLAGVEARVERVTVTELVNDGTGPPDDPAAGVFLARVDLRTAGRLVEVDARPSDAINLALSAHAPLHVADAVMEKHGVPSAEVRAKLDEVTARLKPSDEPDDVELEWTSDVELIRRRNAEGRMPWNRPRGP